MISILPGRPVRCMTSESPSRSPIWLLTIASELLLAIVASLPVERAYWRQSTAGASRPCRAAMQLQKDNLTLRSGPEGRVSKGGNHRVVAHASRRPLRSLLSMRFLFFRRRQLQHVVEAFAGGLVVDFFGRRR